MKKKLIILFLLSLSIYSFADDKFSFEFSLMNTLQIGQAYEYVFTEAYNSNNKYRVLSRLDWPILPAFAYNIKTDIITKHGFHISAGGIISLPSNTGSMIDMDYENNANENNMTKFSKHKCILKEAYEANLQLGWIKQLRNRKEGKNYNIYLEPCVGLRFFYHKWLAKDGYLQYALHNQIVTPDTKTINIQGKASEYSQKIYLPNIGLATKIILGNTWKLKSLIQVCPEVLANCIDNHFERGIIFHDVFILKGFSFHFNSYFEKQISSLFNIFFGVDYSLIKSFNGYTIMYENERITDISPTYSSGTSLYISNYSLGVSFNYIKK